MVTHSTRRAAWLLCRSAVPVWIMPLSRVVESFDLATTRFDVVIIDEAQRSIGMAMQTLMLAAKSMGYDSCPMIGFDIEKVADMIGLPDDHVMGPMVAIGKGTKEPWPKPGQLSLDEVVLTDRFA